MFGTRIRIDRTLLEKARRHAAAAGYSSVEEFVHHALEKEIARPGGGDGPDSEEAIRQRLQGLGYLS